MSARAAATTSMGRRIVVWAALVTGAADPARAADPATRDGGLVPAVRKTHAELVREWDLNSDGKIDAGEAEIASSRMRRERAQLRLNSGIDPVTGRPRGEPRDPVAADEPAPIAPEEPPLEETGKPDAAEGDDRTIPGLRTPRPRLPTLPGSPKDSEAQTSPQQTSPPSSAATRAAADLQRRPIVGGVRAGGLPARAGYGSGVPAAPLNAGLPIVPKTRPLPASPGQGRGGLVPGTRPVRPATPAPPPRSSGSRDLYDPY